MASERRNSSNGNVPRSPVTCISMFNKRLDCFTVVVVVVSVSVVSVRFLTTISERRGISFRPRDENNVSLQIDYKSEIQKERRLRGRVLCGSGR